ncbi:MAG TPA: HD domain-containing phosphohydrolase [Vicinamibacterales bacterium]|nr:HD domain-containing phosphohydrolase [Vicinamibacterales bacterium]
MAHLTASRGGGATRETTRTASILIVDDEPAVRLVMRRWLESQGYEVRAAADTDQALSLLAASPASVVLCDLRMPGRDGLWLVDLLRRQHPEVGVIIATGVNDVEAVVEGLRQGVVDYLTKPFDRERLFDAVFRAVEWSESATDARRWREQLVREMREKQERIAEIVSQWPADCEDTLDALFATLTAGNLDAYAHGCRVAALSATLAQALGCAADAVRTVQHAGLLHDLGKLVMPDAILRKPAPLSAEEQRIVRQHPAVGSSLVAKIAYVADAAAIVRDAQERVDGLGYPRGCRGDAVALGARIVGLADAYDTMIRARVFRDAMTPEAAVAEIRRCRGTQFDPRVVDAFSACVAAG